MFLQGAGYSQTGLIQSSKYPVLGSVRLAGHKPGPAFILPHRDNAAGSLDAQQRLSTPSDFSLFEEAKQVVASSTIQNQWLQYNSDNEMRSAVRGDLRLFAADGDEPNKSDNTDKPEQPGDKPFPLEKNLQYLKDLRETPIEERNEKLDALPSKVRRRLFEAGETGNELIHRLIEEHDWKNFQLDDSGVAGLFPYALLSRMPYLCTLSDDEWISLTSSYQELSDAGFTVLALHEAEETVELECNRVLLFVRGEEVIISLRGTQVDKDWDINLDFFASKGESANLPGGYHSGYLDTFKKLWNHVGPELELLREMSPTKRLKFGLVGHSMGGVLSMMFAQRLYDDPNYDVVKVVTLGGVRGFDGEASKEYEKRGLSEITTRVINFADIVPLGWPNLTHPKSDRLFLTIKGKYWVNPDPFKVVSNQVRRFSTQETHGYDGVKRETYDHDLACYVKILSIHANDREYYLPDSGDGGPKGNSTKSDDTNHFNDRDDHNRDEKCQ